jgi:hypothetical protein
LLLSGASDAVRVAAAHALAVLGGAAPESLFLALADSNAKVRFFVVIALGTAAKSDATARALRARLALETDPVVGSELARVIRTF